jgi:hypothetical protein
MNASGPMSSTGMLIGLVAVIGIFAIPIASVVCHFACAAFKTWQEVGLKRDMVARGYTAQEIIEVVGAKRGCTSKTQLPNVPPAKPIKQPAYTP